MLELSKTYNRLHTSENGIDSSTSCPTTKLSVLDDSSHSTVIPIGISIPSDETKGEDAPHQRQLSNTNNTSHATTTEKREATILSCYMNLTSVLLGSGILGIPFAVSDMGWIGGIVCLFGSGLISAFTLHILALSALNFDHPSKRNSNFM
jgi:hypothetical protein